MATCMFLMIGATQEMFVTTSDNGRYQACSEGGDNLTPNQYMLDTRTGVVYEDEIRITQYKNRLGHYWKRESAETDWIYE